MLLPFTESLTRTNKFDPEMALLYDGHYSRQTVGSPQFMPPGYTFIVRDAAGLTLFGFLFQQKRDDGQAGINCTVFRNLSSRLSSEIILESERLAFSEWLPRHPDLCELRIDRMFTYVDAGKLRVTKTRGREVCHYPPGRCFIEAGWQLVRDASGRCYQSTNGLHLLEKFVS